MPDGQHIEGVALPAGKAFIKELLGNASDSHLFIGIEVEDTAHHLGLRLVDGKDTVLFVIAPQFVIAQHMAVFDGLPKAKLQPFR